MEGRRRQRGTSERVEESGRSSDDGDQRWSHEVALARWEEEVTCVAKRLRVLGKLLAVVLGERGAKGEGWIVREQREDAQQKAAQRKINVRRVDQTTNIY